jgi:hypothetical protein
MIGTVLYGFPYQIVCIWRITASAFLIYDRRLTNLHPILSYLDIMCVL